MWRLPERWGPFRGVEGLPLILVLSNALVFVFNAIWPGLVGDLLLIPSQVHAGEWWRLLTFALVPPPVPESFSFIWITLWLMLLHAYATALEAAWGTFRFTLYFLLGTAATAAIAVIPFDAVITNAFLQASLLLAFATLYPKEELLLFFVIPVQVRFLGYITWVWMAWVFLMGSAVTRLSVAAALVNYVALLGPDLSQRFSLWLQVRRNRKNWKD
jgi:hypothetical protein